MPETNVFDPTGIPLIAWSILSTCEGILVGSQARRKVHGNEFSPTSDFDVLVPLSQWRQANLLAQEHIVGRTKFGGIRLKQNNADIDVFTDDWLSLVRYCHCMEKGPVFGIDYNAGIVLQSI